MESTKIYSESLEELDRMRKSLVCEAMTIDFGKMDQETRGQIIAALSSTISKRSREIQNLLTGVNK